MGSVLATKRECAADMGASQERLRLSPGVPGPWRQLGHGSLGMGPVLISDVLELNQLGQLAQTSSVAGRDPGHLVKLAFQINDE